jgi:hypothetical protein
MTDCLEEKVLFVRACILTIIFQIQKRYQIIV